MRALLRNNLITGCLCAIGCETLFGLSYVFTKQATSIADPFAFLGWRYLIAAIMMILLAVTGLIRVGLKGKKLRPLLLVALFNPSVYFIGETIGVNRTSSFIGIAIVVSIIAGVLALGESFSMFQMTGAAVIIAGVCIANSQR